jgi:dihydroxy-acid dehydratase
VKRGNLADSSEAYFVGLMNASGIVTPICKSRSSASSIPTPRSIPGTGRFRSWPSRSRRESGRPAVRRGSFRSRALRRDGPGEGMRYVLVQRDLIAASIESMVSAHGFDGLVFLCGCDKIVPGMMMAAAHLNLPSVFVTTRCHAPLRGRGEHLCHLRSQGGHRQACRRCH